jgi:hypothetical protein
MSSLIQSIRIGSSALAALVIIVACRDSAAVDPPPPSLHALAANPTQVTASAEWSEVARNLVRTRQSNAFQAVRNYATLNYAQYQAVIAAERSVHGHGRVSERAAVAAASAVTLAYLYPSEAATLDALVHQQVTTPGWVEHGVHDVETSLAVGRAAAEAVVARAKTDRMFDPWTGTVPTGPGIWYSSAIPPAPPGGAAFGAARTFFLESGSQFRPAPPPAFGSPEFNAALAEVRHYSDTRTSEQDSLAKFWALPTGTFTVAGYWNREAAALATERAFNERRTAHLLAVASMATFDALIACNDAKYVSWLLRPTQADPGIKLAIALPNFPSYPSNTACISAAESEVIGALVPGERGRLSALADEAAHSRIFAGIHYRFDGEVGLALGRRIARHALDSDAHGHDPLSTR